MAALGSIDGSIPSFPADKRLSINSGIPSLELFVASSEWESQPYLMAHGTQQLLITRHTTLLIGLLTGLL